MKTSELIDQIATALSAAQGETDAAKKTARNPFFRSTYADLAAVKDAIREPFAKHGLSFVQFPTTAFQGTPEAYQWTAKGSGEVRHGVRVFTTVAVLTRLLHRSGQWIEGDPVSALLPNGDPQSVGSAISYLKRYALQAIAGIASEDDDAEATATTAPAAAAAELAPVVHPAGYLKWLDETFRPAAKGGTAALETAWSVAPRAFQAHLTQHAPDLKATLKDIAAVRSAAPGAARGAA